MSVMLTPIEVTEKSEEFAQLMEKARGCLGIAFPDLSSETGISPD